MAQPATTSHETVEHAAKHGDGEFPPFNSSTYPAQLIWLAITFGFLLYAVSKWVAPRLGGIIEGRRETIAADLERATGLRRDAEAAGAAYEASLTSARARSQAIAQETRSALAAESDGARKALEADLASRLAEAEASIAAKTRDAMSNVRGIATDAASAIVERLTGRAPDRAAVDAVFDRKTA